MSPELVLSIGALFISVGSAVLSWKTSSRQARAAEEQTGIARRLAVLEEGREEDRKRALLQSNLRAVVERRGGRLHLVVSNDGPGRAAGLHVEVDGAPIQVNQLFPERSQEIPQMLPARSELSWRVVEFDEMPSRLDVLLRWNDEADGLRTWEAPVPLQ